MTESLTGNKYGCVQFRGLMKPWSIERQQIVRGGNRTLPVTCGVPQGSIIGPILFILFTTDLSAHLTHGVLISYADDTVHVDCAYPNESGLVDLKARLELTMCELNDWFSSNSLKLNEKKTSLSLGRNIA